MKKHLLLILLSLPLLVVASYFILKVANLNFSGRAQLTNAVALEKRAQSGDKEAQIRLVDFYGHYTRGRDRFKSRLDYWQNQIKQNSTSPEYSNALSKIAKERKADHEAKENRLKEWKASMESRSERYKNGDKTAMTELTFWEKLNIHGPYTWRYRVTINIDTPEGVKSGSAIYKFHFPMTTKPAPMTNSLGSFTGEAISIDLGQRGKIYALLFDPTNADNRLRGMVEDAFPLVPQVYDYDRYWEVLQYYSNLYGTRGEVSEKLYPVFVHFRDTNYPQTAEVVFRTNSNWSRDEAVDRLEEVYGNGVRIKSIVIEPSFYPIIPKLHKELVWMKRLPKEVVEKELDNTQPRIHMINGFGYHNFSQGLEWMMEVF